MHDENERLIAVLERLLPLLPGYPPEERARRSFLAGAWDICGEELYYFEQAYPGTFDSCRKEFDWMIEYLKINTR